MGYYVLPPYLALTMGFKEIYQEKFPSMFPQVAGREFRIHGPTLGFTGAVPMKWGFSLYGSFAYGFMHTESDASKFFTQRDDDRDAAYWLVETGVAYTHDLRNLPVLSSATFYAGYRHQQVETHGVTTDDIPRFNNPDDNGVDITRGMVRSFPMNQTILISDKLYVRLEAAMRAHGLATIEQLLEEWQAREDERTRRRQAVQQTDMLREWRTAR